MLRLLTESKHIAMPIYEYNGKRYNIPEAKAQELITRMPGAKLIEESPTSADKSPRKPQSGAQNDIYVPQVNQTTFDSEMVRQAQAKQLGGGVTIGQKQNIADVTGDMYGSRDLTLPEPTNAAQEQDGFWGTIVGDFGEKIGAGALNLAGGLAKVHENTNPIMLAARKLLGKDGEMVPDAIPQQLLEKGKEISERGDRYGLVVDPETGEARKKTYSDLWKEGRRGAAVGEAMLTASESLPTSAMAMVPGGGLALIGLSVAGQTYNELDNNPETKDLPEWKKILNASATGAIEGLTERLGAKVDMKVFEPVLKKMGEQTVKGILKKGGIGALIQTITEGGEEVISQLGGNVVDYATGVSDEYKPFEGVKDSFVYGAAGGAQFGGVTGAGTIYRAVEQHKANVETAKVQNTLRLWESINKKQSQALPALNNEKQNLEAELGDLTTLSYEEVLNSPESTPELIQARERYDIVNAEYEGVMENLKREVDDFIAPQVQAIQDVAKDGVITELNVGTEEAPDIVYLVKGDVAINDDGTIDPAATSPMLTVKNSEGKKRMIARSKIATAQQDDLNTTIEGIQQRAYEKLVRPVADKLEGKTHFQNGEQVEYVNAKGETVAGTVTAKQNNTVTVVGIDGKKTETFTEDELAQRLVGETIDDVRTRDVIQVQMNGQVYDADVTNIQDGIAELHIPSFPEAAGRYQDVTAAELRSMRVMPQAQVKVDSKTTQETAENEGEPAGQIEQNVTETAETTAESQITPEQQQEQFIASLPKTKEGDVDYTQIEDDDTFITALKSEFPEDAAEIVEEYKKQAQKKLSDAGRVQDPVKKKRAQRAAQAQVDRFNGMYERLNPKAQYQARVAGLEEGPIRKRESNMGEYLSLRDYLLRNIATGKFKFRWNNSGTNKGLAGEILATKNTESERKIRLPYLDNNGHSPESLAEYIYENAGQGSEINPGWFKDDSDIRNEIIDVLQTYDKPTRMIDAAAELHKQPESLEEYYENFVDPEEIFNYEANEISQNDMLGTLPTEELHNQISDQEVELYFTGNNSTFDITNTQQYDNQNEGTRAGSDRADAKQFGARTDQGDNSRNDGGREDQAIGDIPFAGEAGEPGERSAQTGINQPSAERTRQKPGRSVEGSTEGLIEQINPSENVAQNENIDNFVTNDQQDEQPGEARLDNRTAVEGGAIGRVVGGQPQTVGINRTIQASNSAGSVRADYTPAELEERYESGTTTTVARLERERSEGREENARAADRLGGYRQVRSDGGRQTAQTQEGELETYAKENGFWLDTRKIAEDAEHQFRSGKEADVYLKKDGATVVKIVDYSKYSKTPLEFIENRILLFNDLFRSTAYTIVGFTQTDKGFSFVLEQPFIKGILLDHPSLSSSAETMKSQQERVAEYMRDKFGMQPTGLDAYSDGEKTIQDIHLKNVIEGEDGNLYIIDAIPSEQSFSNEIESEAAKVDVNPTEAQKEAGNYKKGHVNIAGFDITIDNPKGSERSGTDTSGRRWTRTLKSHYGYFKRTQGKDGDQIDVFIGENPESRFVFVVDQLNQDGSFDEHKVMLGYDSFDRAKEAYLENYEEGWQGLGAMTVVEVEDFRKWLDLDSKRIKPFAEYKQIQETAHEIETTAKPAYGANNKIITQERYNELREQMRKKLNNLNVGFDPEVFSIGAQMAMFHIESGAHKFADFAKRMVDDLGDAIRPYLKASYEGARAMPGMEELSKTMDPYKEVQAFDVNQSFEEPINNIEQNEQGTRSTEAIEAETETIESASDVIRSESENVGSDQQRAGDVKEQADEQVKKVETLLIEVEQKLANLKLSGKNYSTDGIAADYPINALAKGPIKKDATAYVKAVAAMTGLEHDTDRKGKTERINVNIAPAGGNVTFVLWSKKNPDYGVYVSVPYSPEYRKGYDDYHVEGSILWRVTTKQDKWRGLSNQYVNSDVTAQEMAETLLKGLNQELRSRGLEQEINQVEKAPETVKNKRINKKTSAKVAKNQTNMLSLFGEEDDVDAIESEDEEVLNDDDEDLRFRSMDEAGFYSTVEDALEKIKQEKGTPEQFKAMLLKNGAKQGELDYMDFDGTFTGKSITKSDIQDWIDQNRIEVQEVEKSDDKIDLFDEDYKNAVFEHAKSQLEDAGRLSLPDYQKMLNDWLDRPTNMLNLKIENVLWREGLDSYPGFRNNNGYSTKFAQYTLPGGKNYRELLLTMPVRKTFDKSKLEIKRHLSSATQGTTEIIYNATSLGNFSDDPRYIDGELRQKSDSEWIKYAENAITFGDNHNKLAPGDNFKSGHFDEPNILAHVRFNERTVNGERVLFIEEIQSDWAQEGKKKGFKENTSEVEKKYQDLVRRAWDAEKTAMDYRRENYPEMSVAQAVRSDKKMAELWYKYTTLNQERISFLPEIRKNKNKPPDMPFKKTDQWVNLALRRMMMYAAENGYDRIAWTTGQQQADRYDLSKQVDWIEYGKNENGTYWFTLPVEYSKPSELTEQELESYVGKDVAKKMIDGEGIDGKLGGKRLQGGDLKVGGSGMIAFYDQIVPKAAKKLAKPFGAEVETIQMHLNNVDVKPDSLPKEVQDLIDNYYTGEVEMDELSSELDKLGYEYSFGMDGDIENVYKKGGDSYSFQSIPITDALREIAPGGLPLFRTSKEKANEAYAQREWKRAENAVNRLANKMGVEVELLETTEGLPKKKATSHGWYDVKAKKITIVMPNHRNSMDVQATFLHEAVGHHGLRELFGKHFNTFLDNVYNNAEEGIRDRIDMIAEQDNFSTRKATEEYLSQLAEDPRITETEKVGGIASFFRNVRRFFFEMLAKAGFNPGFRLSNNELKYILWRSYNNLAEPGRYRSIVDHAKDVAMQDRLKVGNYAERGTRANVAEEPGKGESPMFHSGEKMSELDERLKSATRQGVKTETVRQIIDEIESVHTSEIEATVVNNKQELIDLLRMMNANEEMVAEAEDPDVPLKGVYFRGMIFINAGEMNSVDDVLKVWVHENFHAWMKKDPSKIVPLMGVFSEETLNNNLYKGYHKQSEAVKIEEILAFAIEKVYVGGPLTSKRDIRDHLDPIIKQYLDYATEGEFSKRNPDFGRGRGRNADALLDNEGSGREGVAAARKGGSPYQQRQANEAVLPGDERVPGEEVKRADELFDNIDNLKSVVKDYGGFLGKVFEGAPNRGDMLAYARENGFDKLGEGIEQYLADVEDPAELSRIKELLGVDMPDNALRYMLWRNANPDDGTVVWKAKEAVKTNELDENILFRKGEVPSSIKNDKYEKRIKSRHNRGFRSLLYGIEEGWLDRMASLRIIQDAITGGKAIPDRANAYMLENQLTSRNTADIRYYTKNLVDPFLEQIHKIFGIDRNAADEYMNAKHGLERNDLMAEEEAKRKYAKNIASLNKEYADEKIDEDTYNEKIEAINGKIEAYAEKLKEEKDYSGLTAIAAERGREDFKAVAQEIVAEIEGGVPKEDIDALWSRVNSATKWILDKQYNAGIMTKDIYEKIRGMYKYYVPLRGFEEVTATDLYEYIDNSPSNFEGTVKKAYGRTSKAESPTATIMSMGESGIMQANRNRMKQAFYRLVATNPSNYASIEDVWFVKNADGFEERFPKIDPTASADEVLEAIADFNNEMAELAAEGQAFKGRNKLDIGVKIMKAQASEHVIRVWIAGEEKVIFINGNPRAAQAINGLVQKDLLNKDNLRHGVHYWSRQMAANFTSRNPAFMVTNLMRDVQFAVVSAAVKEGVPYSTKLAKNVFLVGKTISANVFKDGNKDNAEFQKYWEEFEANGGETGYANLHSIDYNRKYVNKKLREFSDQRDFLKPFRAYVQFMENGNRMIEDMSRFATYVTSRQMGRSIERSVSDAKEITINFNRKGSGGALANFVHTFYLFANPALQSMRLLGMMGKNHPVRFTAMLSSAMGAGFMVPMINELLLELFGDDDDKEKYQNITPWVRRNNLVLYVPGTKDKFVTLMLPHELRAFYGIGEMAYEKANGGLRRENMVLETVKQLFAMAPIDPMSGPDWLVPDVVKPLYQAHPKINRNFMGSPIYRDTPWNKLDPEWTKAYKGTPELLVEAAKGASDITGGDEVVPGWFNANPARAYHLFSGYLGGFMTTYTDMSMIAFNLLTGRDVRANDVPVVNKLIRTSDEKTEELRINSEYFYYIDWIREYEHRTKGYEKRVQDPEYRDKYMDVMRDKEQRMYNFAKGQIALIDQLKDYDEEKANEMKEQFVRKMWEYEDQD